MTASEEFKQELQKEDLNPEGVFDALKMALSEAVELQITTWVVAPEDVGTEAPSAKPGYRMRTRINIVDGDIDNEVGRQFLSDGPYQDLRDFHLDQVQDSREIVQQNLINLQHLFGILATNLQRLSKAPAKRLGQASPSSGQIGP